jgi:hypothetical protein
MSKLHTKIRNDRLNDIEKDYQIAREVVKEDFPNYTRDDYYRDTEDAGFEEFTPSQMKKWKREYPKIGKSKVVYNKSSFYPRGD